MALASQVKSTRFDRFVGRSILHMRDAIHTPKASALDDEPMKNVSHIFPVWLFFSRSTKWNWGPDTSAKTCRDSSSISSAQPRPRLCLIFCRVSLKIVKITEGALWWRSMWRSVGFYAF